MQLNNQIKSKLTLLATLLLSLVLLRVLFHGFELEYIIAICFINIPSLYWIVIPVLLNMDMEMPSWSFKLTPHNHKILRLILFVICITIYLIPIFKA